MVMKPARVCWLLVAFSMTVAPAAEPATRAQAARNLTLPANVLTALPAIGTVYWRAACGTHSAWALGLKAFRSSATDQLSFHAGQQTITRTLQPSGTIWFPMISNTIQQLRVRQGTEAGLLRATVTVSFAIPPGKPVVAHCYSYAPPRVTVEVYPR